LIDYHADKQLSTFLLNILLNGRCKRFYLTLFRKGIAF
jgi:hypothetical protein